MDFRERDHNVRRNLFRCSMPWLKITPLLPSVMCSREKKEVQFMTELLGNSIKTPSFTFQVMRETGKTKICLKSKWIVLKIFIYTSTSSVVMLNTTVGSLASPNAATESLGLARWCPFRRAFSFQSLMHGSFLSPWVLNTLHLLPNHSFGLKFLLSKYIHHCQSDLLFNTW